MNFANRYEEEEFYGREALKELQRLYPFHFKYDLYFNTDEYGCYDCLFFILDEKTLNIKKRVLIEIKQRSEDYDEMILESKKYNSLLKYRENLGFNKDEMVLWYLNFTPTKTIIWDLDKIDAKIDVLKANKATVDSTTNKVNKSVIYLTPESGKVLPYRLNRKSIMRNIQIEKVLEENKKTTRIGLNFMFDK